MIVYLNKEGRLGHQLGLLLPLLANAIKFDRAFYYESFSKNYKNIIHKEDRYVKQPSFALLFVIKIIYSFLKIFRVNNFSIAHLYFSLYTDKKNELIFDDTIEELFQNKKKYVITDYMFNDVHTVIKYIDSIKSIVYIEPYLEEEILKFYKTIKQKQTTTVAIHIRKTDFKDFADGRFFFNETEYKKVLDKFMKVMNFDHSNTAIILCSDEKIDTSIFQSYNFYYEQRSAIKDFAILKNADYIICTRSIFSSCASLLGENYIYQFSDIDKDFSKKDIVKYVDLMLSDYDLKIRKDNII